MTQNKLFLISSLISSLIVSFILAVIYASATTTISTNIDTGGTLTVSGNVGIGTTTPSASLSIVATPSATGYIEGTAATIYPANLLSINETVVPSGTTAGNLIDYIVNPPSNPGSRTYTGQRIVVSTPSSNTQSLASASLTGAYSRVYHQGSGNLLVLRGYTSDVNHTGSGTITSISGSFGSVTVTGSGNVGNLYGIYNAQTQTGGGDITTLYGLHNLMTHTGAGTITNLIGVHPQIINTGGTIVNAYAFKSGDLTGAGTINNTYGFYAGDMTSGTQTNIPYSFYASDAGAYNYFAGNVGIGTTTPKYNFVVNGTTNNLLQVASSTNQGIFIINSNGNVGIGTSSPAVKLDVNGLIKAHQIASTTCAGSVVGSIFYNQDNDSFWGCKSSGWVKLDN